MPTPPIGQTIKAARTAAGLSQEAAARVADVTLATWCRVERGEQVPRLDTVTRMLGAVGMTLEARKAKP